MRKARILIDKSVAVLLIAATFVVSCSLPVSGPGRISESALISASGRAIDIYLDDVRAIIEDELPTRGMLDGLDGYDIATRAIEEENGREYLEFALETSSYDSAEAVLESAEGLLSDSELDEIRIQIDEAEARLLEISEPFTRLLSPSQEEDFYNDLKKLVIKSAVLLTAAAVYAFVPTTIIWGKVTAAAAVAIAAGIMATSIMAVVEYYKLDMDAGEAFEDWLTDVTTKPFVYWGIASAMLNLGKAMGRSPVLSSVILVVFTIFGVVNEVKPMLEKYNFSA